MLLLMTKVSVSKFISTLVPTFPLNPQVSRLAGFEVQTRLRLRNIIRKLARWATRWRRKTTQRTKHTMATAATTAGGPATGPVGGGTAVGRKKDGGPSTKFWESSETISQLETVRLWIGKHYKKVS